MHTPPSLWQRLIAATPPFFKRLQTFGIGLAGLGVSLSQISGLPVKLTTIIISVGSTITIVSQFAVQQLKPINHDDIK
ncbi:MAG: hypothetical protein V4619_00260 [Bacteroidota bacterium]